MSQAINSVEVLDNGVEVNETISVKVTANNKTETFHIQTVDGEYRSSLGCLIFTDSDGDDLDQDNYPDFDFSEIISEAEEMAELNLEGKQENPNYVNKDASPYTRRFS
jgi:hypothetical protein